MKKKYTFKSVTFGFSLAHRKWVFENGKGYQFITPVKGGYEVAEKIAHFVSAGLMRTKKNDIDNLARANIYTLIAR